MKSLIIRNCSQVVSPASGPDLKLDVQSHVSLYIKEGIIRAIASEDELTARYPETEDIPVLDASGRVVLPGLIDCHTHLPFVGTRESEFNRRLHGEGYMEIAAAGGGILSTVRKVRNASRDDLTEACLRYLDTFASYGVTTVEAKSGYGLTLSDEIKQLEAVAEAAARHPSTVVPTLLAAHEYPMEYRDNRPAWVEIICGEIIPVVAERKLAVFQDVFCEEGVFSVDDSRKILKKGLEYGLIPRLHADECKPSGAAELAAELKAKSADHMDFPSEEGIRTMAENGVVAVLLPGASLFLLHKTHAPARTLIDSGVKVALSTDFNPGSSPTMNLPFIMKLGCFLLRMTVEEVIHAVTCIPAESLNLGSTHGRIQEGMRGDISLWDTDDYLKIFYHFGDDLVWSTVIGGEIVYRR